MSRTITVLPPQKQNSVGTLTKKKKRAGRKKKGSKPSAPPKNQAPQRGMVLAQRQRQFFRLSPCSEIYLHALLDPFSTEGGAACIPDLLDLPSFKYLSIYRGTFNCGAQTTGFVLMDCHAFGNTTTAAIVTTDASFASNGVPASLATAGINSHSWTTQPFTNAQFGGNGLSARPVGVGLRARYLGTELDRSGRLIPYRANSRVTALANSSTGTFLARPEIPSLSCDREWVSVTYLPLSTVSFAYGLPDVISSVFSNVDLGIYVDGAKPGAPFEYEIYGHYEVVTAAPGDAPPGMTSSHSDVAGMSAIRNVLEGDLPIAQPESNYNYIRRVIRDYAPEDMSSILSEVVKTGKTLAPLLM